MNEGEATFGVFEANQGVLETYWLPSGAWLTVC